MITEQERKQDGEFPTRNSALAAYLRIEGFTLLDVMPTDQGRPAVFYFEDTPKIYECGKLWELGKAIGNLSDYYESYKLCLKMVRVGKRSWMEEQSPEPQSRSSGALE